MDLSTSLIVAYWLVALVASALYGWKAVEIFTDVPNHKGKPPSAWWWHQRWLNFAGSVVGWVALWVVGKKLLPCFLTECAAEPSIWLALSTFIAFVGVTGYLPFTVVGLVSGASVLASKAADVVKELFPKPPKGDT
jgi:hypothetical protein